MNDITLHLGDCLDYMRAMPDKAVDCIITDPPYGMSYESNRYKHGNPFGAIDADDRFPVELIAEFKRLARKAVLCFCRWDNLREVEKPKSFIVWVKNNWTAGDLNHEYGRMWEGILFYPMEKHSFKKRLPDVINCDRVSPDKLLHPTQKPLKLISNLIENNTDERDLIFDPFFGSGTTGVACVKLNRRFIGCEISEAYYKIADKRIREAANDFEVLARKA